MRAATMLTTTEQAEASAVAGEACKERGVAVLLGGRGAWPAQPSFGVRVTSFAAFHDYLADEGDRR